MKRRRLRSLCLTSRPRTSPAKKKELLTRPSPLAPLLSRRWRPLLSFIKFEEVHLHKSNRSSELGESACNRSESFKVRKGASTSFFEEKKTSSSRESQTQNWVNFLNSRSEEVEEERKPKRREKTLHRLTSLFFPSSFSSAEKTFFQQPWLWASPPPRTYLPWPTMRPGTSARSRLSPA